MYKINIGRCRPPNSHTHTHIKHNPQYRKQASIVDYLCSPDSRRTKRESTLGESTLGESILGESILGSAKPPCDDAAVLLSSGPAVLAVCVCSLLRLGSNSSKRCRRFVPRSALTAMNGCASPSSGAPTACADECEAHGARGARRGVRSARRGAAWGAARCGEQRGGRRAHQPAAVSDKGRRPSCCTPPLRTATGCPRRLASAPRIAARTRPAVG